MSQARVLILRAPGTNCDQETAFAFEQAGGRPERLHINRLLEQPRLIDDFQILCLPGGFSYGDDIAAGRILANQVRHHLAEQLLKFRDQDKLILGIGNGFQVLIRGGLLLPEDREGAVATLTWNDSGNFESQWVHLGVASDRCVMLQNIEQIYLPIAHTEGKFVTRNDDIYRQLDQNGQLVLRYRDKEGAEPRDSESPGGSMAHVAGVCDTTGRVLGMMPHPERYIDPLQHPHWTRLPQQEVGEGLKIFQNAVQYFQ